MSTYKVECNYIYGWDDAGWSVMDDEGERPLHFDSQVEAQAEIDEVCTAMGYGRNEYRIVEVSA